jgi:hypothetical protein
MDYERQNAKEWQMDADAGPGSKGAEHDFSDEDYADYVQAQHNTDDIPDADLASGWQQVSHKRQSVRLPSKLPGKIPVKLAGKSPGKAPVGPPARSSAKPPTRLPPRQSTQPKLPPPKNPLYKTPVRTRPLPISSAQVSRSPVHPGPMPFPQRARPRVTFTAKSDNPARAAFRAHLPHTGTLTLPRACHLIEPDRPKMYAIMEEMGVRLGSFIQPPQHLRDLTLLLWGDDVQVAATKEELGIWIRQSETARSSLKGPLFAKSGALSEDKAKHLECRINREVKRQEYQKAPPPNMTFNCTGYFLWPVDEIRPEELLGPSFEAFDQIRMFHLSYIVFDNQNSVFKIMSDNMNAVMQAIKRIQGTMKEYVARSSQEIVLHVIEAPSSADMRKEIKTSGGLRGTSLEGARIPLLTGPGLQQNEIVQWEIQKKMMVDEQFEKTRIAIRKGLSRIRYYRGRLRMRVLLGTFALTTFRRLPEGVSSIPFERFIGDMSMSATKGRMIKEYVPSHL